MGIDWSKAREGYDYHIHIFGRENFYRLEDDRYVQPGGGYIAIDDLQNHTAIITERPKVWGGEGLPPVGLPVEHRRRSASNGKWYPTIINFLSGQHVIYNDSDGHEVRDNPVDVLFRPIRTPELIAAEEREQTALDMAQLMTGHGYRSKDCIKSLCEILYDAGYRKFEIVEGE